MGLKQLKAGWIGCMGEALCHPKRRKAVILWTGLAAMALVGGLFASSFFGSLWPGKGTSHEWGEAVDNTEGSSEYEFRVKTICPKPNPVFRQVVQEPAHVEAFYQADLYARVEGTVKSIRKNLGDMVTEGEVLIEIDVPDLVQEVHQKEAMVKQAKADLLAAEAEYHALEETVAAAQAHVDSRGADVDQSVAIRDLRRAQLRRIRELAAKEAVTQDLVDEKTKDLDAAEASCRSVEAAVRRARADLRVVEARVAAARADLEVKHARIHVAQEDRKRVQALADLAILRAEFNGVVLGRYVDPGAFVQNATTARTKPLLAMVRTDKVTVAMFVPEKYAALVNDDTEAIINLDALPGQPIRSRVTRRAPALDPEKGRTMRVEVDLYNPPERSYRTSVVKGVGAYLAQLGATSPADSAALLVAGRTVWGRKGRLQPGMYGSMLLVLQKYENAYLIPSRAVFPQRDGTFIFQVVDGMVRRVPVRIQYENGSLAKVAVVERPMNTETGEELLRDLTGQEEIILNAHGEIEEGRPIKTNPVDW